MANEKAANALEKSHEKSTGRRPGRRSVRSGNHLGQSGSAPARKPSRWTRREYMLQLSVVILGVVITFVGSGLIEHWARQKQLKKVMRLVACELIDNRTQLRWLSDKLDWERRGMIHLWEHDLNVDAIAEDSLMNYRSIIFTTRHFRPTNNALDVLKTTGLISSLKDEKLLLYILGSYSRLWSIHEEVELYSQRKLRTQDHLIEHRPNLTGQVGSIRNVWKAYLNNPVCSGFINTSLNYFGYGTYFGEEQAWLDATIAVLGKKYGFE